MTIAALACACGGGGGGGDDDGGGGGPDAPPPISPIVHVSVHNTPALAVYREAAETTWRPLTMTSPTSFELQPRGPYLVTLICRHFPNTTRIYQFARTPDDPPEIRALCQDGTGSHQVSGNTVPPTTMSFDSWLSVGTMFQLASPSGSFQIPVPTGRYDIIARGPTHLQIRRGIDVSADQVITPNLNPVLDGAPLGSGTIVVTNSSPTDTLSIVFSDLETANGGAFLQYQAQSVPTNVTLAPDSVLEPTDVQTATYEVKSGTSIRGVARRARVGDPMIITLPPYVQGLASSVSGRTPIATWSTLPDHTEIRIRADMNAMVPPKDITIDLSVSRAFEKAMQLTSVGPDLNIPDLEAAWQIDITKPYALRTTIVRVIGNDTLYAGLQRPLSPP